MPPDHGPRLARLLQAPSWSCCPTPTCSSASDARRPWPASCWPSSPPTPESAPRVSRHVSGARGLQAAESRSKSRRFRGRAGTGEHRPGLPGVHDAAERGDRAGTSRDTGRCSRGRRAHPSRRRRSPSPRPRRTPPRAGPAGGQITSRLKSPSMGGLPDARAGPFAGASRHEPDHAHPPIPLPAGVGGWSWPRLFRHLGIGPSAASMLALPYLHRSTDRRPRSRAPAAGHDGPTCWASPTWGSASPTWPRPPGSGSTCSASSR